MYTKNYTNFNQDLQPELIESNKPLSQSIIWKLQSDFYANQGPDAWIKGIVPQYITTNPYIADLYSKIVFGYCRDISLTSDFDKNSTIYIMELAAGVGRFTFTFLKRFIHYLERSSLRGIKFKYIVTDFAEQNISYWMNHSYLKPYFESGILDCATFDITKDNEIHLRYSGDILKKEHQHNPLIILANYTFDSLPQDTFYMNEGKLYEGLITVTSNPNLEVNNDNSILANLDYTYTDNLIEHNNYYEESNMNEILSFYKDSMNDSAVSIPIVAIRCINRLIQLFGDDVVLLSTDKGYRNIESMDKIYHPFLSKHGSISLTVNYHAMELYFNSLNGRALHSLYDNENVTTSLFMLSKRSHDFVETSMAFTDIAQSIGPDDFYTLKKAIVPHHNSFTTRELLTFLRYTIWDSRTFLECYNTILNRITTEENFPTQELVTTIRYILEYYFPIGEEGNLIFSLGSILAYLGYDLDAIECFQTSIQFYGEDATIYYEIALCYYNLQFPHISLEYIMRSLDFDPDYEDSLHLRSIIEDYMAHM